MILTILQARMSSTRLPGKVLKPILGESMIIRQIERLRRAKRCKTLIIATSIDSSDDPIEELCIQSQIQYFRGSLYDVLDRFYDAAKLFCPRHIVRITGDCPLIDPEIVDKVIDLHLECGNDYTSNDIVRTFPVGLDVEVFRYSCLEAAWSEAILSYDREHVTSYIYQRPDRFKIGCLKNSVNLSHLRWTVDHLDDFNYVKNIYEALYPVNPQFTTQDILDFLTLTENRGKSN